MVKEGRSTGATATGVEPFLPSRFRVSIFVRFFEFGFYGVLRGLDILQKSRDGEVRVSSAS